MLNRSKATIVTCAGGWSGIYIDNEMQRQNHSVSIDELTLDDDQVIDQITKETVNIQQFGRTTLPEHYSTLETLREFADTVENNQQEWRDTIRDTFEQHDTPYIMTDEADDVFDVPEECGKALFNLFSKQSVRNTITPLGSEPLVELDHDNSVSGVGPAAYTLSD